MKTEKQLIKNALYKISNIKYNERCSKLHPNFLQDCHSIIDNISPDDIMFLADNTSIFACFSTHYVDRNKFSFIELQKLKTQQGKEQFLDFIFANQECKVVFAKRGESGQVTDSLDFNDMITCAESKRIGELISTVKVPEERICGVIDVLNEIALNEEPFKQQLKKTVLNIAKSAEPLVLN